MKPNMVILGEGRSFPSIQVLVNTFTKEPMVSDNGEQCLLKSPLGMLWLVVFQDEMKQGLLSAVSTLDKFDYNNFYIFCSPRYDVFLAGIFT